MSCLFLTEKFKYLTSRAHIGPEIKISTRTEKTVLRENIAQGLVYISTIRETEANPRQKDPLFFFQLTSQLYDLTVDSSLSLLQKQQVGEQNAPEHGVSGK